MNSDLSDPFDAVHVYRAQDESQRPVAELEMREACQVMYRWREHEPMLAGGALWAWAANVRPRDIDIFIRHSFWHRAHGKARRLYGPALDYPLDSGTLGGPAEERYPDEGSYGAMPISLLAKSKRYSFYLPRSRAPIDLVVTKWSGRQAVDNFDYAHCQVGFAPGRQTTAGANYYAKGVLKPVRLVPTRSREVIEKKLQFELWGRPWAVTRLLGVLCQLDQIYKEIEQIAEDGRKSSR